MAAQEIVTHHQEAEIGQAVHNKLLTLVGEYLALGGMPEVVQHWINTKNPLDCAKTHATLLDAYRQDFGTYARKLQIKYIELLFCYIPIQLGQKFKYSDVEGQYRKRELAPALDLLVTAGIAHKVYYSAGQGTPLGALIDTQDYKLIFLDIGLAQAQLGIDVAGWFLQPNREFVNKGALVEAFVGQELLAYAAPYRKDDLYYWHKESRADQAEIDYLIRYEGTIIPIEVKSGLGRTLASIKQFLNTHKKSPYGLRFSAQNYSVHENIHSYPLYAVAKIMSAHNNEIKQAIQNLLA